MIVNGQYVKYDENKAASIQTDLNKIDDLQSAVKSDIEKPKDALENGSSLDFGFSIFDQNESNTTMLDRYGYYREMSQMEFINRGLEVVADDSTLENTEGNVVKFYSNNESIKDRLWDLFHNRLDINTELWGIVYETSKMGNNYYEVVPDSYENPTKVIYLRYLKPEKVERIEQNGKLLYYSYKTEENRDEEKEYNPNKPTGGKSDETVENTYRLQPWQIIHFKVKDDKDENPYGASLLKAGIRTYRRLSLLEDVILVYRVSRAPERRVFYIDVGQMNYTDSKKFVQKIKSQYRTQNFLDEDGNINRKSNVLSTTSDIFVPRREGGAGTEIDTLQGGEALKSIDDLEYFKDKLLRLLNIPLAYLGGEADRSRGCVVGTTMIKLADGRELSIEEIAKEYKDGKQNYVYSIDEKTLDWTIKPISWAGITGENMEVVRVTLDNNEEVVCTPDHKFMLRNGNYCEAKDLKENDSLMPIYTKHSSKEDKDKLDGYEMLFNNKTGKWQYTHRVSKKEELDEAKDNMIIHHDSFNKLNNNPNELILMDKEDHFKLHSELVKDLSRDEKLVKRRNESIKKFYNSEEGRKVLEEKLPKAIYSDKRYEWLHSEEHKELKRKQIKRQREEGTIYLTDEGRKKISEKNRLRWEDPQYRETMKEVCLKGGKVKNKNNPIYRKLTKEEIVETFENGMTTYELSKALNTSRGTLKRTLRKWGYKNWYEFCEENSLIPKKRVNHKVKKIELMEEKYTVYDLTIDEESPNFATSAGIVIHNSLASLDIKFSRFIERIQGHIKKGLNKICAIDLYFAGYKKNELTNFSIEMTPPSNIKEVTDIDIMNQRMSLISTIQQTELFSQEWILKNILKMNEKEISDIKLQKQMEQQAGGEAGGEGGEAGGFAPAEIGGEEEAPPEEGGEEAPPEEGGEEEAPPEEGGEAETADTDLSKENQITEALVNVLGKDFIIKESQDFFRLMKFIKDSKKPVESTRIPLMERASEIVQTPIREGEPLKTTPSLRKQMILGEMKGLTYQAGDRYMKLYENKKGEFKEVEVLLDE